MTGHADARWRRRYRALLRIFPGAFRDLFALDMEETFVDGLRQASASGAASRRRFLVRAGAGAVSHGLRERFLSPRSESSMFHLVDLRHALRLLRRAPLFTLLTVLVLAGGLGLSIFTWTFLQTAMLRPLPVPGGDRIVRLMVNPGPAGSIDAATLAAMRPAITTLTDLGAYGTQAAVVGTGDRTTSIDITATEWNLFAATRTRPMLGRPLQEADQAPGAEPVVVLGHRIWMGVFGGDSGLVGRTVALDGQPVRVIGVMPEGFGFPVASDAWRAIPAAVLRYATPNQEYLMVYARLAPGVARERAEAELGALLRRAREGVPVPEGRAPPTGIVLESFPIAQIGAEAPLVLALLNALAALILLLACINVTNLLLARANERARETSVRLALGAPRGRLIMQSMWESILLCLAGGVLATIGAAWGLEAINGWARSNLEGNLAFWWVWGFDRTVVYAAGAFVTLAVAVLGGVMARRATTSQVSAVLQDGMARSGGRREGRVARALVVTQVATVSVLMFFGVMSGIVAYRVANVDMGYDTRHLLSSYAAPPAERHPDAAARAAFYRRLRQELAAAPAIDGAVLRIGLGEMNDPTGLVEIEGSPARDARSYVKALGGPLDIMGIDLRAGRYLDERDAAGTDRTVIVSEAMAARYWPGASPIGRRIRLSGAEPDGEWRTVVGVVSNVLMGNPLARDRSNLAVYVPLGQTDPVGVAVIFRSRGDPLAAEAGYRAALRAVDAGLGSETVSSFEETLAKTTLLAKSVMKLFGACFGFALLLAVSGTYGLMARSIGRRTRELGVRRALGATDRNILAMLLGQGGRQLGVGALFALPATLAVGYGFARYFPIALPLAVATAVLVCLSVGGVVLLATWIPVRRAVAIPPRDALWRE